ncbi:MAG: glycosyltransferase family 4 protein [Candidatus Edwardsbacteria bacterium]|jgi:glycosyltransferase involved in cell wall biosynthesis|nr:glycosyltransferase family 4 protein [Candidatus Edwardsbacteria bacterium]
MRILHIVTSFPRREDDVITPWLVELLKRQKAAGLEPEVFAPSYKGLGDQIMFGMTVHRFRYFPRRWEDLTHDEMAVDRISRSWLYKLLPAFYLAGGVRAIWRLCRRNRYDAVHVHWPLPHAAFGWVARLASGARVVTTFYGAELRWVRHSLPWLAGFLRWSAAVSDRVTAISTFTARELREYTDQPVEVIPYTIGFPGNSESGIQNSEFKGNEILTVGRLVERKGVRYLIEACGLLPDTLGARLVIAGGGPLLQELKGQAARSAAAGRIEFTGLVTAGELDRRYRGAAVYVQPAIVDSRGDTEMLGVVLLEAMHHGVPVVGSEVGGITDIIIHDKTGLLVPEKDPAALARAIESILTDKSLRDRLVDNARKHLADGFDWDTIIKKWITLYVSMR